MLSFDDEMVSAALGERFGEGNQSSGQSFLEKIIQVPLKIPSASRVALQQFCFDIVNKSINSNSIRLTENEARSFSSEFLNNISIRINTPRLAVRYGNTLSFSLPLMYGEVNIVDLMLIEAVKIFYPKHYEFIKLNPEYFIASYSAGYNNTRNNEKIQFFKEQLEATGADLSSKQKKCIQHLLEGLFPKTKEALQNYSYSIETEKDWFKNQRIASPKYFNRYFSYAVIKGEISDIAFKSFISDIPKHPIDEIIQSLKELIDQSSSESLLLKIRSFEEDLSWETSSKLSQVIAMEADIFPKPSNASLVFTTPNGQAVLFITQAVKNHKNKKDQLELIKLLLTQAKDFEFAFEIAFEFRPREGKEDNILTDHEYQGVFEILLERGLNDSTPLPIFETFPNQTQFMFSQWAIKSKIQMTSYVKKFLKKEPSKSIDLLRAYTPTIISSAYPEPYKSNFLKDEYIYFISLFDKEYIKKTINKVFSDLKINKEKVEWTERGVSNHSDINMVRQFFHWYNGEEITTTS